MLKFERLEDRRLLDATPMGESYFVFEDWASGRSWVDAEKSPSNTEDDCLCWVAAAANILDWGGWGVGDLDTCDEIFAHLQDHCPDTSGLSQPGVAMVDRRRTGGSHGFRGRVFHGLRN